MNIHVTKLPRLLITFLALTAITIAFTRAFKAQNSSEVRDYTSGHFEGTALNTTVNHRGKVTLDTYDFDPRTGSIRAYFGFSEGLWGEAWLTGNLSEQGKLHLIGNLANFQMEVIGQLKSGRISANYQLAGALPQTGNFEADFQHQLSPFPALGAKTTNLDLIGAWETGGGIPSQVNPVTGETTGVSFVEARRLEIFPDGRFTHLRSHRHCEGSGLARCCEEGAVLERGTLSFTGSRVSFRVEGGDDIFRNGCNSRLNHTNHVKPNTILFDWSLRRGADGNNTSLCLQRGTEPPVCYQKQTRLAQSLPDRPQRLSEVGIWNKAEHPKLTAQRVNVRPHS